MAARHIPIWLMALVLAPLLVALFVVGLWAWVSLTARPFHRNAQDIPSVAESTPPPPWAEAAAKGRDIVRAVMIEQNLPGVSVAVGVAGNLVWAEGFGLADVTSGVKVAPDMRFRLGNGSMVLTSAAVGLLLEQGRLNLDEEIQTYVPAYPKKERRVTLRQLMAHVAGTRNDAGDEGPFDERCERPVDGLRLFADKALLFEPGARYHYSSFGWILVSAAIEAAAGEPFYTFMRRRVFEPLEMDDTREDSVSEQIPGRVSFYFPRFAADPRYGEQDAPRVDFSCYTGAFNFLSTPSDLVRFGMAVNSGKLLQPATVDLFQTSVRLTSGQETGYGLGWDVEDVDVNGRSIRITGHDGQTSGGTVASLWTFREQRIVVAVMTNMSWADTFGLMTKIAQGFAAAK